MTPSMILWTLELLDWIRGQLADKWPNVRLRGSAPDITPVPYRIRFREDNKQYWLVISPDAMQHAEVSAVVSLLEKSDWIPTVKKTGGLSVEVSEETENQPTLIPWHEPGPEVKLAASA